MSFKMLIKIIRRKALNDVFFRGLRNMATPTVEISEGQLRGKFLEDLDGNKFYAFLGVPYAKPPVGDLRFKVRYPTISVEYYTQKTHE